MIKDILSLLLLIVAFLPFILFVFFDTKSNLKKNIRNKQFFMPIVAVVYCIVMFIFLDKLGNLCIDLLHLIPNLLKKAEAFLADKTILNKIGELLGKLGGFIDKQLTKHSPVFILLVAFNTLALLAYVILKKFTLAFFKSRKNNTDLSNKLVSIFYDYDEKTNLWYIKSFFGQARTFLKTAFYATAFISALAVLVSAFLCRKGLISVPFYPVFAIILIGEMAFFVDGCEKNESEGSISADTDNSERITNYAVLRKKLGELFSDKMVSDGTTVNNSMTQTGSIDQILEEINEDYGRVGQNYSLFIKRKVSDGLIPNADYLRSGIDLAMGKSLLFNTPFYYKLAPYAFYAMQSSLLKGGKVLIVLGRHGTSDDVIKWCTTGLYELSNLPNLWKIGVLGKDGGDYDVGLVTRSGVHDIDLHKANRAFLREVSFVVLIEPSRLVTTAQIGLNLLVRNFLPGNKTVYCSVDRNCDGLVDALSHILMTEIVEVSATEYPEGTSSYVCWLADNDYLHHRLTPGISRYLGMGTEFSFVALKNQVEKVTWYGGEAFPVLDEHWISKQYYHDLLTYTGLPATQETFDKYFKVSFNICNEQVQDNSYITVEDEFNNLFEIKRELSTISRKQGFVNVISSEYMLREYMTDNEEIFNADAKAIPYVSADYARTKRNVILKICIQMSLCGILKNDLKRDLILIGADSEAFDLREVVWSEFCKVFAGSAENGGTNELVVDTPFGAKVFTRDTITFKHEYSTETGKFEDFFVITDRLFKQTVIDGLQNAKYIAEIDRESSFLGTELKGHILQKYLPGQFFTFNGKYYEMTALTADNQVLLRRASEYINNRVSYRQIRKYRIDYARDADTMGMLKTVRGIGIHNQFADLTVETPAYWRLNALNDFKSGTKVVVNNIPERTYYNKQILKLDFSDFGEAFTDEIRVTLTVMINEVFSTFFAENAPYIVAVTKGDYESPLTFSLDGNAANDNCIYIIEDSQLDIGLLVAVERSFERIMQLVADYLDWNRAKIDESMNPPAPPVVEIPETQEEQSDDDKKKKPWYKRLFSKDDCLLKGLFRKKDKKKQADEAEEETTDTTSDNVADKTMNVPTEETEGSPTVETAADPSEMTEDISENGSSEETDPESETEPESELPSGTVETVEVIEAPKDGFFKRLFGKKDKPKKEKKEKKKKDRHKKNDDPTTESDEPTETTVESDEVIPEAEAAENTENEIGEEEEQTNESV